MATTPRFGLEYFGGDVGGSLDDAGGKFTRGDRLVIDRLMAAFEAHTHGGGARLTDPTGPPTLTLQTTGGQLPSATTYFYSVTYIDRYGLETAAGTEASVTTPAAVSRPQGPGLVTEAGGTLAPGLYMYALTAHKGSGETMLSNVTTITVSDQTTVRVSIPGGLPAGATGISVWRQGPTETWFTRVRTQATAADWVDNGSVPASSSACEPANQPPSENTTEASNQVVVDAPVGDLVQPTRATRWRIYRSTTSGVYGPKSLVADIADTTTEGGLQLVQTYTDTGAVALADGSPPATSRTLAPTTAVEGGASRAFLLLRASDDTVWQLSCSAAGVLETTQITLGGGAVASFFADSGFSLVDSATVNWRVTVSTSGVLAAAASIHVVGERQFAYGAGPDMPTVDGTVFFRLGVTTGGVLTTFGNRPQATHTHPDNVNVQNNATATSYTLALTDAYRYVRLTDAGVVAVTVPTNASVAFEIGTVVQLYALGAGGFTFAGAGGVTVNGAGTVAQYGTVSLVKVATNEWDAAGAVA